MSGAKELLAEAFGGQARWRSEKAEEYPDDERNPRSAAGRDHLAEYVVSLSDTDERVRELATLVVNLEANVALCRLLSPSAPVTLPYDGVSAKKRHG